jgi:hypothetical protein
MEFAVVHAIRLKITMKYTIIIMLATPISLHHQQWLCLRGGVVEKQ